MTPAYLLLAAMLFVLWCCVETVAQLVSYLLADFRRG